MPDISMCANESCTLKEECYRYTATPNPHRQSYGSYTQDAAGKCDRFWDNKKRNDNIKGTDSRDNK